MWMLQHCSGLGNTGVWNFAETQFTEPWALFTFWLELNVCVCLWVVCENVCLLVLMSGWGATTCTWVWVCLHVQYINELMFVWLGVCVWECSRLDVHCCLCKCVKIDCPSRSKSALQYSHPQQELVVTQPALSPARSTLNTSSELRWYTHTMARCVGCLSFIFSLISPSAII